MIFCITSVLFLFKKEQYEIKVKFLIIIRTIAIVSRWLISFVYI